MKAAEFVATIAESVKDSTPHLGWPAEAPVDPPSALLRRDFVVLASNLSSAVAGYATNALMFGNDPRDIARGEKPDLEKPMSLLSVELFAKDICGRLDLILKRARDAR